MLADLYRQAFRNGSMRFILRRAGNIFLAGAGESGSATAAMLVCSTVAALNPPSSIDNNTPTGGDGSVGGSGSVGAGGASGSASIADIRSGAGSGSSSVKGGNNASIKSAGAKSASASAAASAASGRAPSSVTKRNSEMLGDEAQALREKEAAEMAELDTMKDELQMLLVAALVRMARR